MTHTDEQIRGMTDRKLAQNLRDADRDGDVDNIIYYENEIIARLHLGEFPHGLTPVANAAITKFCRDSGVR